MTYIHCQWDSKKNRANIAKHKVSFEEAKTVFYDNNALLIADTNHSDDEERFIILRIISARKATKNESKYYWGKK